MQTDPTLQTEDEAAAAEQVIEAAREATEQARRAESARIMEERAAALIRARTAVAKAAEALERLVPRIKALQQTYAEAVVVLATLEATPLVTAEGEKPTLMEMLGQQARTERVSRARGIVPVRTHRPRPPMFRTRA